jgi:ATP-binding cassette subfamily F protein 3
VVAGVSKAYRRSLFEDFSSVVRRGDRVAIVGPNSSGKTTLLKIIAGLAEPDEGDVRLAKGVVVGYLPQEQEGLPDMRVLDYFRRVTICSPQTRYQPTYARSQLAKGCDSSWSSLP